MLEEIGSVDNIPEFIAKVKDKNSGVKLMGFGHRVYKNYDPRATVMRETCHEVLKELGTKDDLLQVADSKYALVILGAKRARQINAYYSQLSEGLLEYVGPLVDSQINDKPLSISLRELNEGLLDVDKVEG